MPPGRDIRTHWTTSKVEYIVLARKTPAASERMRRTRVVLDREVWTNFTFENRDFSVAYETVIKKKARARIVDDQAKMVCLASPK